jgi:hypothetical protein
VSVDREYRKLQVGELAAAAQRAVDAASNAHPKDELEANGYVALLRLGLDVLEACETWYRAENERERVPM